MTDLIPLPSFDERITMDHFVRACGVIGVGKRAREEESRSIGNSLFQTCCYRDIVFDELKNVSSISITVDDEWLDHTSRTHHRNPDMVIWAAHGLEGKSSIESCFMGVNLLLKPWMGNVRIEVTPTPPRRTCFYVMCYTRVYLPPDFIRVFNGSIRKVSLEGWDAAYVKQSLRSGTWRLVQGRVDSRYPTPEDLKEAEVARPVPVATETDPGYRAVYKVSVHDGQAPPPLVDDGDDLDFDSDDDEPEPRYQRQPGPDHPGAIRPRVQVGGDRALANLYNNPEFGELVIREAITQGNQPFFRFTIFPSHIDQLNRVMSRYNHLRLERLDLDEQRAERFRREVSYANRIAERNRLVAATRDLIADFALPPPAVIDVSDVKQDVAQEIFVRRLQHHQDIQIGLVAAEDLPVPEEPADPGPGGRPPGPNDHEEVEQI